MMHLGANQKHLAHSQLPVTSH